MTLVLIPAEVVSDKGLVDYKDMVKFLETDTGAKAVIDGSKFVTLEKPGQILWTPYGMIPVLAANMWADDDKTEMASLWWLTIFNTELAKNMNAQTWKSTLALNKEHQQKMSGQPLWQDRLNVTKKLETAHDTV